MFDVIALFIVIMITILLTIVTLPVALLLLLLEWALGARREEGPLVSVRKGRRLTVAVSKTVVTATGWKLDRMLEGEPHRLYFTRVFHKLINYERLGREEQGLAGGLRA